VLDIGTKLFMSLLAFIMVFNHNSHLCPPKAVGFLDITIELIIAPLPWMGVHCMGTTFLEDLLEICMCLKSTQGLRLSARAMLVPELLVA
jgi:hypothetical protein